MLAGDIEVMACRFHRLHDERFGHSDADSPVELVNLRVSAVGTVPPVRVARRLSAVGAEASRAPRTVVIAGTAAHAAVLARRELAAGDEIDGPAVLEQDDTTTIVPAGWHGVADAVGNLILTRGARQGDDGEKA